MARESRSSKRTQAEPAPGAPGMFSPVRRARISDEVLTQIRAAILGGHFQPGDRLPSESEMVSQFGVSRISLRDARRTLEAMGLVEIKVGAQGGAFVSQPDTTTASEALGTLFLRWGVTFQEIAEARLALEITAVRLACERATEADLAALRDLLPGGDESTAGMSLNFHAAVVDAAHNRALTATYAALHALLHEGFVSLRKIQPSVASASEKIHQELYGVIEARDADRAESIMRDHLRDFSDRAARAQQQLDQHWPTTRGEVPAAS